MLRCVYYCTYTQEIQTIVLSHRRNNLFIETVLITPCTHSIYVYRNRYIKSLTVIADDLSIRAINMLHRFRNGKIIYTQKLVQSHRMHTKCPELNSKYHDLLISHFSFVRSALSRMPSFQHGKFHFGSRTI